MTVTAELLKEENQGGGIWRVQVRFTDSVSGRATRKPYKWALATTVERQARADEIAANMESNLAPKELANLVQWIREGHPRSTFNGDGTVHYSTQLEERQARATSLLNMMLEDVDDEHPDQILWVLREGVLFDELPENPYWINTLGLGAAGWVPRDVGDARAKWEALRDAVAGLDHGKGKVSL